jgi:phosphatidylethanolamine/phosphatidyl-N-methylethanolamine N-methyltransferase
MKLTNRWNRLIYRLWSPVYDALIGEFYAQERKRAVKTLNLQPGEKVLLVGVGTGADLRLLPEGVEAVGLDLSPDMLKRARAKLPLAGRAISLIQADAQLRVVQDSYFDGVIFNLILSVIPDGAACWRESLRALKPGGRAVVFDKFLPEAGSLSLGRRILNVFTTLIGTDINRRFGDLTAGAGFKVVRDEPSLLHGAYRIIEIRKDHR